MTLWQKIKSFFSIAPKRTIVPLLPPAPYHVSIVDHSGLDASKRLIPRERTIHVTTSQVEAANQRMKNRRRAEDSYEDPIRPSHDDAAAANIAMGVLLMAQMQNGLAPASVVAFTAPDAGGGSYDGGGASGSWEAPTEAPTPAPAPSYDSSSSDSSSSCSSGSD